MREGDPLEIFTDREGEVILKKYSRISPGSMQRALHRHWGVLCVSVIPIR
ncbi:MAG: hypothetical protein V8S01_06775 [Dorea sp.]